MRFSIISTIFRKEILEVIRDQRMLFLVILMPFFLYPALFTVMGKVQASSNEKMRTEKLAVTINEDAQGTDLAQLIAQDSSLEVSYVDFADTELDSTRGKQLAIILPLADNDSLDQTANVSIFGDDSEDIVSNRRRGVARLIEGYGQQLTAERVSAAGLPDATLRPFAVEQQNTSIQQSPVAAMLGRFIPVMLLLFVFIGCIYIAIDITAGEKERRTLQTIYTTPASTNEIVFGKFLAVASIGLLSSFANLASLIFGMRIQANMLREGASSLLNITMGGADIAWLILLVALATIFLASLCLAVVLLANSYKEAQGYVTPLMMLVLIPALIAGTSGIELSTQTALIPVFNICVAMAAIFKGNYEVMLIGLVAVSAIVYGLFGLWLAGRTFSNENIVTGEKVTFKSLFGRG